MKNNILFIFSHQDDEMGLFNVIEKATQSNHNVFVIYLTTGLKTKKENNKSKLQKRDLESLNVLLKLGLKRNNIIFLGKKLNIPVYDLYKNLDITYNNLEKLLKNHNGKTTIYTHAWEGGNEDHDSCYVIVTKFLLQNSQKINSFQFSQYHAFKTNLIPFKVQSLISSKSKVIKYKLKFFSKIKYIGYLFNYKSQIYLWLPLFLIIILRIVSNNYGNLKKIYGNQNIKRPHNGKLLYEKLRKKKYEDLRSYFLYFLRKF